MSHKQTVYEMFARDAKVRKLAAKLSKYGITADEARLMEAHHWKQVADFCGVLFPSQTTQRLVIEMLAETVHA